MANVERNSMGTSRLEGDADQLAVVAGVDAAVGERRVRPHDVTAAREEGRLDQVGAVDLRVALRRQLRDDQVALVAEEEMAVALRHDERRREQGLALERRVLPEPFAGGRFEAAQFAEDADAV